jgi:ubiquinone/menaquinone biosynthesis C-methylase UbiE
MGDGTGWIKSFEGLANERLSVYDEVMVPRMFAPAAELLVSTLDISAGDAVLDVACGPGSLTRIAAQRVGPEGRVVGCDVSPTMIALARTKPDPPDGAPIEYLEGGADDLPVGDSEFDVVTCQHGLQFFPDRSAALAEMSRALRPGGRVGIAVWSGIEHSRPFHALAQALEEVVGAEVMEQYLAGPYALTDGSILQALLEDAGFDDVEVVPRTAPVTFDGGAKQLVTTLAVTPLAERLTADEHTRLRAAVANRMGEGPIVSELEANVATARR